MKLIFTYYMDLTPNKLLDNLNKNFPQIVGEALVGYYQFWKMEQDITQMIEQNNNQKQNDNDLSHLLALANCIQYGKSFFTSEINKNLNEMNNIKDYVQIVLPYVTDSINTNGQKGGLPSFLKAVFGLVAGLVMNSCDNATALAVSIASPGQDVAVYSEAGGEFPRARPIFTQSLDINNQTQMEEFSKQFRAELFPEDSTYSVNINEKFKEPFVEDITKDLLFSFLTDQEKLSKTFSDSVENKVKNVNGVMFAVHDSLETMCRKFVETRDPLLPIRLFQLFNDEYEANLERVSALETELTEQKRGDLKTQKLMEMGVTQEEPGIVETLPSISDLGKLFSFGSTQVQTQIPPSTNTLTVTELTQIYDRVNEGISQEIQELGPVFHRQATQQALSEAMSKFTKGVQLSTDTSNLQAYFSAICKIKKTYYVYDKKSGLLTIKNPTRSRFHLTILTRNVVDHYTKIMSEGIKSIDEKTGEVKTDIPDTTRKTNIQSLHEKAESILAVLNTYDGKIMNHLTEETEFAGNIDEFFQALTKIWETMKEPIKQATMHFPITFERERIERGRAREEFEREMEQKGFENAQEIEAWIEELEQKSKENALTEEQLELWNKYIGLKVAGVLDPVKITVSSLLDTTGDIVVSGAENVGKVVDLGIITITRNVYGIAWAGMALIIPLMLGACICGCGPVGALFAFIVPQKKRRGAPRGPRRQRIEDVADVVAPPVPAPPVPAPPVTAPVGFASYRNEPTFGSISNRPVTFGTRSFTGILPGRSFGNYRERANLSDEEDDNGPANTSLTGSETNPFLRPPTFQRDVSDRTLRAVTRNVQGFGLSGGVRSGVSKAKPKKTRKNKKHKTRKYKAGIKLGKKIYTKHRRNYPTKRM